MPSRRWYVGWRASSRHVSCAFLPPFRIDDAVNEIPQDTESGSGWVAPNDPLGAFCRQNHVALKGAGAGLLAGLTFAAKDAFEIAGARTGFGQPDWLRTHPPAREIATA